MGISRIDETHMEKLRVSILSSIISWLVILYSLSHKLVCHQHGTCGFDDFLRDGLIEYLDVNEENNALVHHDSFAFFMFYYPNYGGVY
jgi:hypothetical protein